MSEIPEQVLQLLDRMGKAITELTDKVTEQDAARMSHRHLLSSLLAQHSAPTVKDLLEHLHEFNDASRDDNGTAWTKGYRDELDSIYQDAMDVRATRI